MTSTGISGGATAAADAGRDCSAARSAENALASETLVGAGAGAVGAAGADRGLSWGARRPAPGYHGWSAGDRSVASGAESDVCGGTLSKWCAAGAADGVGHRITPTSAGWRYVGFETRALKQGAKSKLDTGDNEICVVVLSGKARVSAYRCREALGLIWVAIDEPRWDLPEVPELDSPDWITVPCGPFTWDADA